MDGTEHSTPAPAATASVQEVAKISGKSAHIRALLDQFINYNKANKPVPIEIIKAIFPTITYPLGLPYPKKNGAHSNPKCLENEAVQIDLIIQINQDNREGQSRILQIIEFLVVVDAVGLEDFHPAETKEALIGILAQQQTVADAASAILDYCKKTFYSHRSLILLG